MDEGCLGNPKGGLHAGSEANCFKNFSHAMGPFSTRSPDGHGYVWLDERVHLKALVTLPPIPQVSPRPKRKPVPVYISAAYRPQQPASPSRGDHGTSTSLKSHCSKSMPLLPTMADATKPDDLETVPEEPEVAAPEASAELPVRFQRPKAQVPLAARPTVTLAPISPGMRSPRMRVAAEDLHTLGMRLVMELIPHLALVDTAEAATPSDTPPAAPTEDALLPSQHVQLQQSLSRELCAHVADIMPTLASGRADRPLPRKTFERQVARLLGLRARDVGRPAARALRRATLALFDSWDLEGSGELELGDLLKVLRHGGSLPRRPRRDRRDVIFQAEIAMADPKAKQAKHKKRTAMSLAKEALQRLAIQSPSDQLHSRAEKVSPIQLEALLAAMNESAFLDLFRRWDKDGDGTISPDEFNAAIARLGFQFSQKVCVELFDFFDKDHSGSITLDELEATLLWASERKRKLRPLLAGWRQLSLDLLAQNGGQTLIERLRELLHTNGLRPMDVFQNWDDDGGGWLGREELADLIFMLGGMPISTAECDALFASFNLDGSGRVTFAALNAALSSEAPIAQLMAALTAPKVMASLATLFSDRWDVDGDGVLTRQEFGAAMNSIGLHLADGDHLAKPAALHDLFAMLDSDGSGAISLQELEHALRWVRSCEVCQQLRAEAYTFTGTLSVQAQIQRALAAHSRGVLELFQEWDVNHDCVITHAEFVRAMPVLGIKASVAELSQLFDMFDQDGDTFITFREFNRIMRKVSEAEAKGDMIESPSWRPRLPPVAVVDLKTLRRDVKTEYRLRGLDHTELDGLDTPQSLMRPQQAAAAAAAPTTGKK